MKPIRTLRRTTAPTLTAVVARYLAEVSAKKKGHCSEKSIARIWLATTLAGRPVDRIRASALIQLRDEWLKNKAPATVVRRLAFLSHIFTVLRKDWGWERLANPVELVRRPTVNDARDRRLFDSITLRGVSEEDCPRSELDWIIRHTRSPQLPMIALLACETSMRRGELVGIRRERIDLTHGVVFLPDTKNGRPREVPLTPLAGLRQYLVGKPLRGPIFTITPSAVTRAFGRARKRARAAYEALCKARGRRPNAAYFHDLRFHDLRHESTSRLAAVFEIHELAKTSGHRDTRMLLRYYHPRGRELALKLARSPLGRRQQAILRGERERAALHQ